jgi:hypothetical protein
MAEKVVTARKEYECVFCGRLIKKGQKHNFGKTRAPRFSKDDNGFLEQQIGIEYVDWRLCLRDDPECKEGDPSFP